MALRATAKYKNTITNTQTQAHKYTNTIAYTQTHKHTGLDKTLVGLTINLMAPRATANVVPFKTPG